MKLKILLLTIVFLGSLFIADGQILRESSQVNILLSDSTEVQLFAAAKSNGARTNGFYYLPTNMRLSHRDSIPEFSFMAYDKDGDGENDGSIMHLLLTWGLTKDQLEEAEIQLRIWTDSTAVILGSCIVESNQFSISSETELKEILLRSLKSKGSEPFYSGGKMALSYMFSKEDTMRMEEVLNDRGIMEGTNMKFELITRGLRNSQLLTIVLEKNLYHLIGEITMASSRK